MESQALFQSITQARQFSIELPSSLFAGVVSASAAADSSATTSEAAAAPLSISSSASTSSSSASAAASLPARQKLALEVMVAHALIENKEFARAEALLKDALQHREPNQSFHIDSVPTWHHTK